jgi:transmembrane sensor
VTIEQDQIVDRAIGWHLRRAAMSSGEWAEFVIWLEASPLHARAYDEVALLDSFPLPVGTPANDNSKRWWQAAGVAAAAAIVIGVGLSLAPSSDPYSLDTGPGERRELTLIDGTRIEINGATRLTLDRQNSRIATLVRGEATFNVKHDDKHPFRVTTGSRTIEDVGTIFNISREGPRIDVQVAEGAVMFEPQNQAIKLVPGDALSIDENRRTVARSLVGSDTVGGWRRGALSYSNVPLWLVRDSLRRSYRVQVDLAGGLSDRSFSGMVHLTGNEKRDIPHFAALIGADWRYDGMRWTLSPKKIFAH